MPQRSHNKAYVLRSMACRLAMRHIAQKDARRHISKTLYEIVPPFQIKDKSPSMATSVKEIMNGNNKSCILLKDLEYYLNSKNITIIAEGNWTGDSDSIYYDCVLSESDLRKKFKLPSSIKFMEYDGRVGGQEAGFYCDACKRSIVGNHILNSKNKKIIK